LLQPLHIAVSQGFKHLVKSLLEFQTKASLLIRNADGSIPLHLAAQAGVAEITQLLAEASPTEALHCENAVGETPLEIASLQELVWRTRTKFATSISTPVLDFAGNPPTQQYFDLAIQEVEIPKLRATLNQLLEDGRLKKGTKTTTELLNFAVVMEAKLATTRTKTVTKLEESKDNNAGDIVDREATLRHIKKGVASRPCLRTLVHLVDVQRSVERNLARVNKGNKSSRVSHQRDDDEPEPEEDAVEKQKRQSIVLSHVHIEDGD
jgi:Ankyrin repeats (3 copies)